MKRFRTISLVAVSLLGAVCSLPYGCVEAPNETSAPASAETDGSAASDGAAGDTGLDSAPVGFDDPSCQSFTPPKVRVVTGVTSSEATEKLAQMTMDQKIAILSGGDVCPGFDCDFDSTGVPALGIDDFKMRDGPRGVHALSGALATTWAVAEARAASFDLDLERRVGEAQAKEMRALKYDLALAPTVNVLRHPGWARAQETYGEDPVLLGEMGAAFTNGMQTLVPACPKHFAGNNTDENRNKMIAYMDEQTLRENYTRAFKIVVEKSDPACIMAAYNGVNGEFSTENAHLLTDILRTDWRWEGFVVSDWWATKKDGPKSLMAGLDLEMPDKRAFEQLPQAVANGTLDPALIDQAALRILKARGIFGQFGNEYRNSPLNPGIVNDPGQRALALETAVKGAVLLKNEAILPIGAKASEVGYGSPNVKSIVVLGPDAHVPITDTSSLGIPHGMGDRGSSNTNPPYAVSYFDGISARAGSEIAVTSGTTAADADGKDLVIIPVTMAHEDEGEAFGGGGDRDDLTLGKIHPLHWSKKPTAFINEVAVVNPNIVVLLAVGSAVVMDDWADSAKAIVQPFYPGQEAGTAVAQLLFGDVNFGGKLPFTVAHAESDYPVFGNLVEQTQYDYLHGYRKFEAENITPRYWFGYGLSYTTYSYSALTPLCTSLARGGRLNFDVAVTNTGSVAGDEIVQAYVGYPNTAVRRPPKELKAFARVSLAPGETRTVQLTIPVSEMAYWSEAENGWRVETGIEHMLYVGPSADPATLLSVPFIIN
jgi:beta-glucosidase